MQRFDDKTSSSIFIKLPFNALSKFLRHPCCYFQQVSYNHLIEKVKSFNRIGIRYDAMGLDINDSI